MKKQFTHFWFDMVGRVWIDQGGVYSLLYIVSDANPAVPLAHISHKKSTAMSNLPMPAALHSLRLLDVHSVRLRRLRSCALHPWASLTSRYDLW